VSLALAAFCSTEAASAGTPCPWDCGGDGITDFLILLANWGPCHPFGVERAARAARALPNPPNRAGSSHSFSD
jgi:hypothetical protein